MNECVPIKKFKIVHPNQLILGMTVKNKNRQDRYIITEINKGKIRLDDMKGSYKSTFVVGFNKLKEDYLIIKYMDFKSDYQLCIILDVDELRIKLESENKLEYGIVYSYIMNKETGEVFKYKSRNIIHNEMIDPNGSNIQYGNLSHIENIKTMETIEKTNKEIVEDYYLIIPTFKDII